MQWQYLDGDGDFRSNEVRKLRDEADIIITNPPFSLFREFLAWIMEANKQFSIIGNMNAITYKEVFPLIAGNQIWLGPSISSGDREFQVPDSYPIKAAGWRIDENGNKFLRIKGVRWFTNIEHGRRHQPLPLMTMEQNLKFSKHKEIRGKDHYEHYDNYDAIEVPYTDAIPSDYGGVMGVPISFLDKYCPEQFEIVAFRKGIDGRDLVYTISSNELDSTHTHTHTHTILPNSGQAYYATQQPTERGHMSTVGECMRASSSATAIPGMIKNAEGKINGRITYARVTIRHRKESSC